MSDDNSFTPVSPGAAMPDIPPPSHPEMPAPASTAPQQPGQQTESSKDYMVAFLLSCFLGWLGVDRFYLGQTGLGVLKY